MVEQFQFAIKIHKPIRHNIVGQTQVKIRNIVMILLKYLKLYFKTKVNVNGINYEIS